MAIIRKRYRCCFVDVAVMMFFDIIEMGRCYNLLFYHENTQNHVEKSVCIFISVGGQDILDPARPVYSVSISDCRQISQDKILVDP